MERISCGKSSLFDLAFWKIKRVFLMGREGRSCYFSAKKQECMKTLCMILNILRRGGGSAFNMLNISCHISLKTLVSSSFRLGFQEADPETYNSSLCLVFYFPVTTPLPPLLKPPLEYKLHRPGQVVLAICSLVCHRC